MPETDNCALHGRMAPPAGTCKKAARRLPADYHGFRRNAVLARQLLDAGYSLSFGEHFDPEALRVTPAEHRFAETDESSLSIEKIIDLQQLSLREFYNKSIKL